MLKKLVLIIAITLASLSFVLSAKPSSAGWFDFLFIKRDFLTIRGNGVFLNDKSLIKLHGVAMGSPYLRQAKNFRDTSDYKIVKSWQANVVRLSVHPGVYKKNEKEIKRTLKEEVRAAREEGLFVIIDWHVIGFPNGSYKPWLEGEYQDVYYNSKMQTAEDFWKYAATEYRSDQGVIFEIWNEPYDYTNSKISWNDIRPYMGRLHDVIRSRGAQNIILAPGVTWSYDLRGIKNNPLPGSNIGYVWHNYPNNDKTLSWNKAMDGLNKQYPIFVTEWGYSTIQKDQHYSLNKFSKDFPGKIKNYIVDNNLNSTAWVWHTSWQPSMLEDDWETPNDFGRFVKAFLGDMANGKLVARPQKKLP